MYSIRHRSALAPWIDSFRKLDDDTLVAMIDMKGARMGIGFFKLRG